MKLCFNSDLRFGAKEGKISEARVSPFLNSARFSENLTQGLWYSVMILTFIGFTVLELLVLSWGLRLKGPMLYTVLITFLLFLLPLPYLFWLMTGARQPGFWTALFLVRLVFTWHFNWLAFLFFFAPLIILLRLFSIIFGSELLLTVSRGIVLFIVSFWGIISLYGLLLTAKPAKVEKVEIIIPGLSLKDDGIRVVQIADPHIAWWNSRKELERIAGQVKALNPDLLVVTGDIVDHNPDYVKVFGECFSQVQPRLGRYAIIGNHDVYTGVKEISERMEREGFKMIHRGLVNLSEKGAGLLLGGMADSGEGWTRGDPREKEIPQIIAQAPQGLPIIWLGHRSSCFDQIIGLPVALTLAGHTHGGQLRLPFGGPGLANLGFKRTAGLYQENGQFLYVSRGLGTVGWPFRINCPREISLILLRSPFKKNTEEKVRSDFKE